MEKKQTKKKRNFGLFVGLAVVLIVLIVALVYVNQQNNEKELDRIYSSIKICPSCTDTLKSNDEFSTVGKRVAIQELQKEGFSGEDLFYETVKIFGIGNIADEKLKIDTYKQFQENLPESRAILELKEDYVDFGNVSESEIAFVMKEFELKNTGKESLFIYQVGTSCSCLTTKLVDDEKESPIMGRFSYPYGMVVEIKPGDTKRLRVTYDARVNSFFRGFETRFVYIHTNDVVDFVQQITIDVTHVD